MQDIDYIEEYLLDHEREHRPKTTMHAWAIIAATVMALLILSVM